MLAIHIDPAFDSGKLSPMAAKKNQTKRKKTAKRKPASKTTKKKIISKKKAASKKKLPKKRVAKKTLPKPKTVAKRTAKKKTASAKPARSSAKRAQSKDQSAEIESFNSEEVRARSAGQSGSLQGLSNSAEADSESVDELLEEGNAFEAGIVSGVEAADGADGQEVRTHEVPEDDVPDEYLDQD
jgi:hypothetical protein